jgi:hypothetical protein
MNNSTKVIDPTYSPAGHMEKFNTGQRSEPAPKPPSIYEQTLDEKLAALETIAEELATNAHISPHQLRPTLTGAKGEIKVDAACRWDSDRVYLTLSNLPPKLAAAIVANLPR